ncbi:MAG: phage portal protein [Eubacterium sp.]
MNTAVVEYLKSKSIKVIEEDITDKIDIWNQWYKGKVDSFHEYKTYSGKKQLKLERKTLNMPSRVAQKWADLLLNEKVAISIDDEYSEQKIQELLHQVNFYVRGNNLIETAFALGGGFFVQYWDGEKTNQKYITQEFMYPISYDSGRLTEVAFASSKVIDGKHYVYLETHTLDDKGEYVVDNSLLYSDGKDNKASLREVDNSFYEKHNIIPKIETHRKEPLFQMVRPNVANKENFNSPYGTSVYAGAIDVFKSIDLIYDSYYKEFLLGKKRIFVHDGVTNINYDKDGNQYDVFDPNDEVFYRIPEAEDGGAPIIESNLALRVAEHNTALQTQLNCLSQKVGFGSDGFKWDSAGVQTATGVISQNSEMFRTIKKHEALLYDTIVDMVKGLLYIENVFGGDKRCNYEAAVTIDFDDSIIEDTAEKKRQAMLELQSGVIDVIQYYQDVYGMTEQQAVDFFNKLQARAVPVEEEPDGA